MAKSGTGAAHSKCKFPAAKLLAVRREVAKLADELPDNDPIIRLCTQLVLQIENKRIAHYEATDCRCWYEAITATGAELEPTT